MKNITTRLPMTRCFCGETPDGFIVLRWGKHFAQLAQNCCEATAIIVGKKPDTPQSQVLYNAVRAWGEFRTLNGVNDMPMEGE